MDERGRNKLKLGENEKNCGKQQIVKAVGWRRDAGLRLEHSKVVSWHQVADVAALAVGQKNLFPYFEQKRN